MASEVPYSQGGFNGSGVRAMESDKTKIEFGSASSSPRLDYNINLAPGGSYYVWVRGIGFDGNSDSVHLGVNGVPQQSAGNIAIRREGVIWSRFSTEIGASATLFFNAGAQTISLFMRESGTSVDAIKLTTDKAYRPDQAASIPTISLAPNTPSSGTITEGSDDGITYTFARSTAFGDLPISVSLFSGTAIADDYTVSGQNVDYDAATGSFVVTFKGTETQASFTVKAKSDAIVEGDETLTLAIDESSGDSYRVAGGTETTTAIKDLPVVTIHPASESAVPIREGESGKAAFVVKRSNANGPLNVTVRVPAVLQGTEGIAAPIADYSFDGYTFGPNHDEFVVSWAADDASLEKTIYLSANLDALPEPEETVTASLYLNYGDLTHVLGSSASAAVVIGNVPLISLAAEDAFASETDVSDTGVFRLTAHGLAEDSQVTVFFHVPSDLPDDATMGVDYEVLSSPVVDVGSGIYSTTISGCTGYADIVITAKPDSFPEGNEYVRLELLVDQNADSQGYSFLLAAIDASPNPAQAQVLIAAWNITAFGVDLGGQGVKKDTGDQTRYDADTGGLDWVDHNADGIADARYPVSYVRSKPNADSFIAVKPEFFVSAGFAENLAAAQNAGWKIVGDDVGTTAKDDFIIAGNDIQFDAIAGGFKISANKLVASQTKLGDEIWHGELKIKWRLENAAAEVPYGKGDRGHSSNTLYVTAEPANNGELHTILSLATSAPGDVPVNPDQQLMIAKKIFQPFFNKWVKRAQDMHDLTYYGTDPDDLLKGTTAAYLLKHGDGKCGGWADLFHRSLGLAGVAGKVMRILQKKGYTGVVPPGSTAVANAMQFDPNEPAQGGEVPSRNQFGEHFVVQVGNDIFDPSYGFRVESRLLWENYLMGDGPNAAGGFGTFYTVPNEPERVFKFDPNSGGVVETEWSELK